MDSERGLPKREAKTFPGDAPTPPEASPNDTVWSRYTCRNLLDRHELDAAQEKNLRFSPPAHPKLRADYSVDAVRSAKV
jgi:hypothetical protein